MSNHLTSCLLFCMALFFSCNSASDQATTMDDSASENEEMEATSYPTAGSIEVMDDALNQIIASETKIEVLAEGFDWSEGPLWIEEGIFLLVKS